MPRRSTAALLFGLFALSLSQLPAVPPDADKKTKAAALEAGDAAKRATVAGGLTATVWAHEPQMANPVSFCFDGKGRAYVAETTRFAKGVPDTRNHMYWVDEDIGSRSVEDRVKMYAKHKYGEKDKLYAEYDDQVRMLWDSTGKGVADKSTVFAGGFNQLKDGLGAGVLARKGSVYYTNIPDLYLLTDTKGEGKADVKTSLATGFGVRAQFIGHDMHGLRMGPDGKLYFSIGDRGFNVTTKEGKKLYNPDSGAVLRCDPDGANMEIVHTGLRNPQELAFDDFGNLFTYDNNCDSGDSARWVYVVEGGDSGWRCGYQYDTLMHTPAVPQGNRGPWNTEKIWHLQTPDQPAYIVPPLAHFGNGPSGLTHYPGLGLNDKYKDHFFACDFTSNPGGSKIWAVSVKPKGAAFEVNKPEPFVQNMVPTDCEFGPDGAFYWSDWVGGWDPPGKGRIFRVEDPEAMKNPAVGEAKKLLAEGFEKKTVAELAKLLEHPHQMVRFEAQYELAGRKEAVKEFEAVVKNSKNPLAKYHAVWGLGMVGAKDEKVTITLAKLLDGADAELKAQALRTLGRQHVLGGKLAEPITRLLADDSARVRCFALLAYSKIDYHHPQLDLDTIQPIIRTPNMDLSRLDNVFALLKTNADKDIYLRQAAVQALVVMSNGNGGALADIWTQAKAKYDAAAVRMGVCLALRRLQSEKIEQFLTDAEPKIVDEAARAIHDENLMPAMPALAKLADKSGVSEAVLFRALSANFKVGGTDNAKALATFAARTTEQPYLRTAALKLLSNWATPPKRDGITGLRQDVPARDKAVAVDALKPVIAGVFSGPDAVRKEAVVCSTKLGITDVAPLLATLVKDEAGNAQTRLDALNALVDLKKPKELADAMEVATVSYDPKVRGAARVVKAKLAPDADKQLTALLDNADVKGFVKQMALEALGKLPESKPADEALAAWCDKYLADGVPGELKLDVLEATKARAEKDKLKLHADLRAKLKAIDTAARAGEAKDHLSRYRESLAGGDAAKGRDIVLNNSAVYCQRCHKLDGQGGEVGPAFNGIARDKTRDYLLESITHPSRQIAKGYESVILVLLDGRSISGVLKGKDAKNYTVVTAENKTLVIPVADVDAAKPDKSAMPEDLIKKLSKRELRDVIEFLSGLTEPPAK